MQQLPQESRTQTILRDKQFAELINPATVDPDKPQRFGPWASVNYQLADLIDAVNYNTYVVKVAGRLENPKPSEPTPRPGLHRFRVRRQSEAAVAYLKKLRGRG